MDPVLGPSNKNSGITHTISKRGKPIIIYKNRRHRIHKACKNGNMFWRCTVNNCHGFLTVKNDIILSYKKHNCERKQRKQRNVLHTEDVCDCEIPIPEKYCDFLLADYNDGKSRILLFATPESKKELSKTCHIYCEGTFDCVPEPFLQIYSIQSNLNGIVAPLAYAFLLDKEMSTYITLFHLLKATIPGMRIKNFTNDFEEAAVMGVQAVFPKLKIKGYYLHYRNALKKKAKELDLYEDWVFRKHVELCINLSYLPPKFVDHAWLFIKKYSPEDDKIKIFNDYMTTQWINHRLWAGKWSCFGELNSNHGFFISHDSYRELKEILYDGRKNIAIILGMLEQSCKNFGETQEILEPMNSCQYIEKLAKYIYSVLEQFLDKKIPIALCIEKLRF